jgi:hypothetical protein
MPRGMQRSNREAKKPKKDKPKGGSAGYQAEGATPSSISAKLSAAPQQRKPK